MSSTGADFASAVADRYRVEQQLGAGGMATVYLATDVKHDRLVALKLLRDDLNHTVGAERFLREIRIASQLYHPHILGLIDSGEAAGCVYYVMPYVAGESLRSKLNREGELPVADGIRILRDIVDALALATRRRPRFVVPKYAIRDLPFGYCKRLSATRTYTSFNRPSETRVA